MIDYYTTEYIKPETDGHYIVLRKGFTYDMGNKEDLVPEVGYWNGGRGCFNEDWDNEWFIYWTEVPKFKGE